MISRTTAALVAEAVTITAPAAMREAFSFCVQAFVSVSGSFLAKAPCGSIRREISPV